ncbi:hypothetical protein M9Y10_034137 [Tritrichomonas musculus]|uniref:Uncharacterized protein n=1 Tax=Tritrichomonas musculus TaxID=1915356 RepID=A0ABR2KE57_9EUKA
MLSNPNPTYEDLQKIKWTKKGIYQGLYEYEDTVRRQVPNDDDRPIKIKLSNSKIKYDDGVWNDLTAPDDIPTTTNPVVSENICLKRRVETLIRTAAISEIEVQQLKEEIKEAKQILAQLAQVL